MGNLVLFGLCSFPASLWSLQRVIPVLTSSFFLANIGRFTISSGKCSECRERSSFHCHITVPAILTLLRHSESWWLSVSLLMFSWLPSFQMWACRLYAPQVFIHDTPVILSCLFFGLAGLLQTSRYCMQNPNWNCSRITFVFNYCFCPRLLHKFQKKKHWLSG